METHARSILKATSYRITGTAVTFLTAWLLIGNLDLAARMGLIDALFKILVFYAHERIWNRLSFGKKKTPEYQI